MFCRESLAAGVLAGYPIVGIEVTLGSVRFVEGEASEAVFHGAAAIAFSRGLQQAEPILLEPIMKLEVVVPEEHTGDIIADVNARRGEIHGLEPLPGNSQAVRGAVPLAEMFGYATDMRSATQGRGAFTMEFSHYAPVPDAVSERILGGSFVS